MRVLRYLGSNAASVLLVCLGPLLMAVAGVVLSVTVLARTLRGRGFKESMTQKIRIGGREL